MAGIEFIDENSAGALMRSTEAAVSFIFGIIRCSFFAKSGGLGLESLSRHQYNQVLSVKSPSPHFSMGYK